MCLSDPQHAASLDASMVPLGRAPHSSDFLTRHAARAYPSMCSATSAVSSSQHLETDQDESGHALKKARGPTHDEERRGMRAENRKLQRPSPLLRQGAKLHNVTRGFQATLRTYASSC